ncbi:hypothetical protein C3L50_07340 [Flavobacterium alvei]|uniref:DUF4359 domain-containing protein n=1 Tax=Flavobacterium alvei TaxID=2080416 RepID=A0A2S5AD10_9FLAO|nr:DUF4359 domain-containing protein [Flavobacterium alvei]POY40448.1 hypothetical protein C3L50_07340 [Flavobacterium alvei]
MKKGYLTFGIAAFIILIAVISNPNEDKHKSAVKSKVLAFNMANAVSDIANSTDNNYNNVGRSIGTALGGVIVEQLINSIVSSDNYLVFSTTKVTWEGETKIIGFGAFGNVFLSDKLEETFEKNREEKIKKEEEEKRQQDSLHKAMVDEYKEYIKDKKN